MVIASHARADSVKNEFSASGPECCPVSFSVFPPDFLLLSTRNQLKLLLLACMQRAAPGSSGLNTALAHPPPPQPWQKIEK